MVLKSLKWNACGYVWLAGVERLVFSRVRHFMYEPLNTLASVDNNALSREHIGDNEVSSSDILGGNLNGCPRGAVRTSTHSSFGASLCFVRKGLQTRVRKNENNV